jgi:hypothetical protein
MTAQQSRTIIADLVSVDATIVPSSGSLREVAATRSRLKAMTLDSSIPPIIGQALVATEKSLWLQDPAQIVLAREHIAYAIQQAQQGLEYARESFYCFTFLASLLVCCSLFLALHEWPADSPDDDRIAKELSIWIRELERIYSGPVAASISHADWINNEVKLISLTIGGLENFPENLLALDDQGREAIKDGLQELPETARDLVATMRRVFVDLEGLKESCDDVMDGKERG